RLQRGAYRALPGRRGYIPKSDGRLRPLAVAALEDKIVQRATVAVLNAIYEEDFLGFSYGFRAGRGPHDALDALVVGISSTKVNWILDADIRSFFDEVSQDWLVRFVKHRIGDPRMIRLIQKWLRAGILEDGVVTVSDKGTGQGSVVSPLLANIYLHYVFDLWAKRWRRREATGDMIIVRYANDLIVGFQHEARRFLEIMCARHRSGHAPTENRAAILPAYLQAPLALRCVKDGDDILAVDRGELANEARKPGDQVLGFAFSARKVLSCDNHPFGGRRAVMDDQVDVGLPDPNQRR